jgi:hypothetical protein
VRFPDIQVHELALSDETGEVDFFVVKDDAWIDPREIRGLVGDTEGLTGTDRSKPSRSDAATR